MLKQMKLIYSQGFTKSEKLEWKPVIFSNIVQSFRVIFEAMKELDVDFESPENEVSRPQSTLSVASHRHTVLSDQNCGERCLPTGGSITKRGDNR